MILSFSFFSGVLVITNLADLRVFGLIDDISLPPEEDEVEVAKLLSAHLARYATIQNVKVIHDSKGGLCAFVQCEVYDDF